MNVPIHRIARLLKGALLAGAFVGTRVASSGSDGSRTEGSAPGGGASGFFVTVGPQAAIFVGRQQKRPPDGGIMRSARGQCGRW